MIPTPTWDSLEAIKAFAGPNYEKAVYYSEDQKFLLAMEPRVRHYEVEHRL
jgi:heme-degrading monooxygenase HmoA